MRIIVDAMGGDNAPESAVWGGALAAKEYGEEVLLVGDPDRIAAILQDKGMAHAPGVAIAPASELVGHARRPGDRAAAQAGFLHGRGV